MSDVFVAMSKGFDSDGEVFGIWNMRNHSWVRGITSRSSSQISEDAREMNAIERENEWFRELRNGR